MSQSKISLVTMTEKEEPFIKASDLARLLEFKESDQVSKLIRRRGDDFNNSEYFVGVDGTMYLNYDGAIKVCMFATTPRSREVREEITEVYKAWRNGEIYSNKELSKAEQALHIAKAVMKIAEVQVELERRQEEQGKRLDSLEQKIVALDSMVNPKAFITDEQASQISIAVRMLGQVLSDKRGKNKYAFVYSELYRRFSITSYKTIPQDKFGEVISWLKDNYSSARNSSVL